MNINFTLNRILYFLSKDVRVEKIEEILCCAIVNKKGRYYGKYVSYLIKSSCDESKLQQLEQTIKKDCALKYNPDTKNYILKVYHYSLPKFLPFQYHQTKDLIIGQSLDGTCKIKLDDNLSNILIVGQSGSGKSCTAQSMIYNCLLNDVWIWIADLKGSHDYRNFNTKIALNIDDFEVMLDEFIDEVERRLAIDKKHKPLLLFIDELFVISCLDKKSNDRIMRKLILVMSRNRSANAHIILICQKATSSILDTRIICNISCKIVLKVANRRESQNILDGDSRASFIDCTGRGYLLQDGNNLVQFQSYYIDRKDISLPKQDEKTDVEYGTIAKDVEYNLTEVKTKEKKEKESFHSKFL